MGDNVDGIEEALKLAEALQIAETQSANAALQQRLGRAEAEVLFAKQRLYQKAQVIRKYETGHTSRRCNYQRLNMMQYLQPPSQHLARLWTRSRGK